MGILLRVGFAGTSLTKVPRPPNQPSLIIAACSEAKMAARVAAELEELLDRMEKGSVPSDPSSRSDVIGRVAKLFGVKEDEVAIMELAPSGRTLRFVMPEKLRQVGSIPLSSNTALAARTARERRSDIINNFSAARHASVFEGVPLGRNQ